MPYNKIRIYPYKIGSRSAKALAEGLSQSTGKKVFQVRPDGNYEYFPRHMVINWGNSNIPNWNVLNALNLPLQVAIASNKLQAFWKFLDAEVKTPVFSNNKETAQAWFNEGHTIVERHILNGHSGNGIRIVQPGEELQNAPLYVQYKKKKKEYRVHIFKGEMIDEQIKKRSTEARDNGNVNTFVRNVSGGWVYCRSDIVPCDVRKELAIRSITALGLDFGAVDIIYNEHENQYYVLEVNTAPGLEGTTLQKYLDAFTRYYNQ